MKCSHSWMAKAGELPLQPIRLDVTRRSPEKKAMDDKVELGREDQLRRIWVVIEHKRGWRHDERCRTSSA